MRKIILLEFLTLDGVIQAPGAPDEDASGGFKFGGWMGPYWTGSLNTVMNKQMEEPFALLLGRKTYDIFSTYWPEHADAWPGINEAPKYVVTSKNFKPKWENTTAVSGNVVQEIKKLKKEVGPDLKVYGSGNLVQTLLKHDLVDDLWLKIFPLTLGKGKKLFEEGTIPAAFKLTECKVSPEGVIFANFKRAGEVKTGSMVE
jgi:dihydrofolate reductase